MSVVLYSTEPGVGKPGRTAPDWGLLGNLIWIIPLALFALDGWLIYRARWYYWRGGSAVGTFSASQLNQLYKTGQIDSKTPIRQVKDDGWHTGVATEDSPRRFGRGLCYALLAGLLGFFLCYALFGQVRGFDNVGRYMSLDAVLNGPSDEEIGHLGLGQTEKQAKVDRNVRDFGTELEKIPIPNPISYGAGVLGREYDRNRAVIKEKVDTARTRILGGAALFTALGAFGGAATARGRARIYKERRVIFKKRRRESSDHE